MRSRPCILVCGALGLLAALACSDRRGEVEADGAGGTDVPAAEAPAASAPPSGATEQGTETPPAKPAAPTYLEGLDLSRWQGGDIDWKAVRGAGIEFVFVKATQGKATVDPRFRDNWAAAKAAGIPRGPYHFYVEGDPPELQAKNLIATVELEPGDLPPVVDVEGRSIEGSKDSQAERIRNLHTLLSLLDQHYGVKPLIYTGPRFWNVRFDGSFGEYPLWVAQYVETPEPTLGWDDWTFWQYTSSGTIPGFHGRVDHDRFRGTREELLQLTVQ